ncbi:uncharacterized protein FA14DRAFT_39985 [Meira miltonrushii]|uniref:SET domain-containing protein n=1 Tax=Meira miltonrushii TaxID=1280837 RepID=A0A316VCP0_9BASI|nr:uncharacterized protein FA14DRAFT_39985 [Meira miltonrushii]PWN35306.1 hypothetical protein FA14DRAFT_39985 [Meira miltonrushii]
MEDLIRSLRNLGLRPPDPGQLWELLDDDKEVQTRLVKLLAFNVAPNEEDGEGEQGLGGGNDVAALMGQDLLQEAVSALLDNFKRMLEKQRQTAQREEAIITDSTQEPQEGKANKGSKLSVAPKKVKLPPRKALFLRHEAAIRKDDDERSTARGYRPRLVFDGSTSFHSRRQVADLETIACKDLDVAPKRFTGKKLVVRVVSSLLLYVGVSFLAEDPDGNVISVAISHFTSNVNATRENISSLLPIGTILAIREPFLSIDHQARSGPCTGKADIGIRVDSPTDIVLLSEKEASDLKWTTELPTTTNNNDTVDAIPWLYDPTHSSDWASTAKKLQEAGRPGAAYRAMLRCEQDKGHVDTTLQSSILFSLTAWQGAQDVLTKAVDKLNGGVIPTGKAGDFGTAFGRLSSIDAVERCSLRQVQAKQGLTMDDVRSIYLSAPHTPRFDTSDFIGPVAVQDIPGAGRGLVLTRDVEPGELLLCCRAVGSAYPDDAESKNSPILRLNLSNGVVSTTSQVRAQTNLIHKIIDRPELALPVLGLTAGPSMEYSEFVHQPFPMTVQPKLDGAVDGSNPSVDPAYVDGVLRFNAFGPAQAPDRKDTEISQNSLVDFGELGKSTMPHPLPAILNHACLPNVSSIFFSDIVTTRALITMKKGTEIVHQYVRGEIPYAVRSAQLSKHGFECGCTLCSLDRADGTEMYTQRARIMQGESSAIFERSRVLMKRINTSKLGFTGEGTEISDEDMDAHKDILSSLQQLLERVDKTYATDRGELRPDLLAIYEIMAKHVALVHHADKDHKEIQETVVKAVQCVGGSIEVNNDNSQKGIFVSLPRLHMDGVIGLILLAAVVLENAQLHQKARSWCRAAFYAHQCMIGGGLDVFMDRWQVAEFEPALVLLRADVRMC